ncbi:MAG: carboxylating nicotinate-nucleotide diphosphorylase [Bacteroidetes bacterium]|nr:carboxylating nicotinate-nucleotide diphosphorylase [Bacteroidota bacterium]
MSDVRQAILSGIDQAIKEDIGAGDVTSNATITEGSVSKATLLIKGEGILAGIEVSKLIFHKINTDLEIEYFKQDRETIANGDIAFEVSGDARSILAAERIVLNCMQRMSGIATITQNFVEVVKDLPVKIIDSRKTTPNFRAFEKSAVEIGGGTNHRMGLYDMILIKDNHIDFSGGIENAITSANTFLKTNNSKLKIEIEASSMEQVEEIIEIGGVDRVMLDNFTPNSVTAAVKLINGKFETEASGGITLETLRAYAETGVNYISVGALTYGASIIDMSLNAVK